MGKNNNSNGYLFLTLILSEIKDLGKQGFTTISPLKKEISFAGMIFFFFFLDFLGFYLLFEFYLFYLLFLNFLLFIYFS